MAKLNKQEVNAIAGKLHRELSKTAEKMREQVMEQYTPSETYVKLKELLEKRDSLRTKYDQLSQQLEAICNKLNEISPFFVYNRDSKIQVLNKILYDECKLPSVPSMEELKDEITIAAIDDCFDTSSYIESQIEKFKIN